MKRNFIALTVPSVASGGTTVSQSVDVSSGRDGFCIQNVGIAASGGHYKVQGSLDGGTTWIELTTSMINFAAAAAQITSPISTDGIFAFPYQFPGLVQILCSTSTSSTLGKCFLAWSDTRTN